MFSSEQWLANPGGDFYNGVATQSLRFDDGSSAYLSKTPSSASNRKTWTWSGWVKRSTIGSQDLFSGQHASADSTGTQIAFVTTGMLDIYNFSSGAVQFKLRTNQLFRDTSAFYHVVVSVDTTQGTASDRVKLYVNGVQVTSFSTESYPSLNYDTYINNNVVHLIGSSIYNNGSPTPFLDGYLSEVNFIDGLALTPTSFGEAKNGTWIAINTSGLTFGTNGFRLQFDQSGVGTASSSTIGADSSGEDNHWTSSGIVASDCAMPDSPENNFCTLNPLYNTAQAVFAEGNLKVNFTDGNFNSAGSTISSGNMKFYAEVLVSASTVSPAEAVVGVVDADAFGWNTNNANPSTGSNGVGYFLNNGTISNGYGADGSGATLTTGDILGISVDGVAGSITFYKNGSSQGAVSVTSGLTYNVAMVDTSRFTNDATFVANFGQDSSFAGNKTAQGNTDDNGIGDFYYAPPSGYLALCTANLPEPTISPNADTQATDHFNTVIYTGDASTNRNITGYGFQVDWIWVKERNSTSDHRLHDSSRGAGKVVRSSSSDGELVRDEIDSFISDGFHISGASDGIGAVNQSTSQTYVAWGWKVGGGSPSSYTPNGASAGVSMQRNSTSGISIVTYNGTGTGNGAGDQLLGHGLQVNDVDTKPDMLIIKGRNFAGKWKVWHKDMGGTLTTDFLNLNTTSGTASTSDNVWDNAVPTSTLFPVGYDWDVNKNGSTYVGYFFGSVEGYSKFGSYTGNGNADGTFVFTGFRPAWILVKSTTSGRNWAMYDNVRDTSNPAGATIKANLDNAEFNSASYAPFDFVSNGLKLRLGGTGSTVSSDVNISGQTYIYMAFAEQPFKYANAR